MALRNTLVALLILTCVSGCGCALDKNEQKDSTYFGGCWDHLRNGSGSVLKD